MAKRGKDGLVLGVDRWGSRTGCSETADVYSGSEQSACGAGGRAKVAITKTSRAKGRGRARATAGDGEFHAWTQPPSAKSTSPQVYRSTGPRAHRPKGLTKKGAQELGLNWDWTRRILHRERPKVGPASSFMQLMQRLRSHAERESGPPACTLAALLEAQRRRMLRPSLISTCT